MAPDFKGLDSMFALLAVLALFGVWKLVDIAAAAVRWSFAALSTSGWQAWIVAPLVIGAALFAAHWLLFGRKGR